MKNVVIALVVFLALLVVWKDGQQQHDMVESYTKEALPLSLPPMESLPNDSPRQPSMPKYGF